MTEATVHTIDLHFLGAPRSVASFLVVGPGGPLLVETGPGSTLPALTAGLAGHGYQPADIKDVLLTHIHLDHAGAAGWWAAQGARIHVHARGAPHLVDPERLLSSARRIYAEHMDRLWGEFLASPAEQVHALNDGDVVEAGGLRFTALDTPGHARHHMAYLLEDAAFVGDVAGMRLPDPPHVRLPTPPPEFDLEAWQASLARLRALNLRRLYATHYGLVDDPDAQFAAVAALLPEYAGRVRAGLDAGQDRDAIVAEFAAWEESRLTADGVDRAAWPIYSSLASVAMSVDGILRYWQKRDTA